MFGNIFQATEKKCFKIFKNELFFDSTLNTPYMKLNTPYMKLNTPYMKLNTPYMILRNGVPRK
jgi:hypothetical protein